LGVAGFIFTKQWKSTSWDDNAIWHCKIRNEIHRRDAENAEYYREKKRRKHKIPLSPCSLCDLCASAVENFTVPAI
jgi:hypothetical protein